MSKSFYSDMIDRIKIAKRPLLLIGGGTRGVVDDVRTLAKMMPTVYTLMGKGILKDEETYGLIGWIGHRHGNWAIQKADVVLAIGTRLDPRITGSEVNSFAKDAYLVHIDIDGAELNKRVEANMLYCLDLKYILPQIINQLKGWKAPFVWGLEIINKRDSKANNPLLPLFIELNRLLPNAITTTDVGQHQLWSAQMWKSNAPFLTSAGLGAMGYGLPAAIGAWYADSSRPIINFTGDGSIQMNIQELDTIVQHNIPIKMVLFNNRCLGLVRQFQDITLDRRRSSTVDGYHTPNFKRVVEAYGLRYFTVAQIHDFINCTLPCLLEVEISQESEVKPMLMGGELLTNQWPY